MLRDILLYDNIDSFSSAEFINAINMWQEEGLTIRVNTNGGEPQYMWGMVAKFIEFEGKKLVKVDGKAYSGGAFFLCYADDSEALDVANALIHRAAYPDWFESNPDYFTEELRNNLTNINKSLEAAFRAKVDIEAFENLPQMKSKGYTTKDVFSMDSRIDIFLNAKEMKKIKLVNRIIAITPAIKTEIQSYTATITAKYTGTKVPKTEPIIEPVTKKVMTKEEFKAAHPVEYAAIVAEGIAVEKDRIEGIMVFNKVAPEICVEVIASGKNLTEKQKNEIILKQMSKTSLEKLEEEATTEIKTGEKGTSLTAEQKKAKEKSDFEAEVLAAAKDVEVE